MNTQKISNYFLSLMLVIGVIVEGANLTSLFYDFAKEVRPNWYIVVNYGTAIASAMFFLAAIVGFGLTNSKKESWLMATITMFVSMLVYRNVVTFSIENPSFSHTHFVVILLSVALPFLVAHCSHKLYSLQTKVDTSITSFEERIKVKAMQEAEERLLATYTPPQQIQLNQPQHIGDIAKEILAELERVKAQQQAQQPPTPKPSGAFDYSKLFPKEEGENEKK